MFWLPGSGHYNEWNQEGFSESQGGQDSKGPGSTEKCVKVKMGMSKGTVLLTELYRCKA